MAKRPKRKKSPRKCIFCGQGGSDGNPMSEEHLWPEWMHPYLPKLEDPRKDEVYRVIRGRRIENLGRKSQQGHVFTKTIKVVCKRCNETWMSAIETAATPILIPLLQGQLTVLEHTHQRTLAKWIALKMIVAENEQPRDRVLQREALINFYHRRAIPRGIKIWIAHHDSIAWYTGYWHQTLSATVTPIAPILRGLKNIQTSAFGIGHLFTFTYITTIRDFEFNLDPIEDKGVVRRLWPLRPGNIVWPMRTISDEAADQIATTIDRILRAPWAEWRC